MLGVGFDVAKVETNIRLVYSFLARKASASDYQAFKNMRRRSLTGFSSVILIASLSNMSCLGLAVVQKTMLSFHVRFSAQLKQGFKDLLFLKH